MNREKQYEQKAILSADSKSVPGLDFDDDDYTPNYLNPEEIRLFRSPMGSPRLEIRDQMCYPRVSFSANSSS